MDYIRKNFIEGTDIHLVEKAEKLEDICLPLRPVGERDHSWRTGKISDVHAEYSLDILRYIKENKNAVDYFKEKLEGEIVLDLGCGEQKYMAEFCSDMGVKLYAGIDKENVKKQKLPGDSWILLEGDLFELLNSIEDDSVHCIANGVIETLRIWEQRERLWEETRRIIRPKGLFFGEEWGFRYNTDTGKHDAEPYWNLKNLDFHCYFRGFILEKK